MVKSASEEFTIFQPASPRGNLFFDGPLTDNPAATGTGGSGFAQFLLGLPSGGNITNLHNVDYGTSGLCLLCPGRLQGHSETDV